MFVFFVLMLFPMILLLMDLAYIFFLVMVVFVSLEVNLLSSIIVHYLFYEWLCYSVCSLYPHKFLQVYHYQCILLYVLCLWNVCKMYSSFLVCDFYSVYNFHRCRGYLFLLLVFELLVVLVFEKDSKYSCKEYFCYTGLFANCFIICKSVVEFYNKICDK